MTFPYYYIFLLLQYYINMIHIHSQIIVPPTYHTYRYHLICTLLHYYILTSLYVKHYAKCLPLCGNEYGYKSIITLLYYLIIMLKTLLKIIYIKDPPLVTRKDTLSLLNFYIIELLH